MEPYEMVILFRWNIDVEKQATAHSNPHAGHDGCVLAESCSMYDDKTHNRPKLWHGIGAGWLIADEPEADNAQGAAAGGYPPTSCHTLLLRGVNPPRLSPSCCCREAVNYNTK